MLNKLKSCLTGWCRQGGCDKGRSWVDIWAAALGIDGGSMESYLSARLRKMRELRKADIDVNRVSAEAESKRFWRFPAALCGAALLKRDEFSLNRFGIPKSGDF